MTAERFRAILEGRISPPPVADLVGIRLTAMEEGRATFEQGLSLLVSGGTFVQIGLSPAGERVEIDLPFLFAKRARILVSHGGDHLPQEDFPRLAQWALEGKLDLAGMVTRTAPLGDWSGALDAMREGGVIRTVLRP